MKVILTEAQLKRLISEEASENLLCEQLNESASFKEMAKKIRNAIMIGCAATTIISAIARANISDAEKQQLTNMVNTEMQAQNNKEGQEEASDDFQKKVDAVSNYMATALKNQGYTMNSTGLKPETMVKVCEEKGFSLPFMMAAAHLESCFGATNRARKTNSVFSVGSYDNGKNVVTYSDPNDSVADYVDLLERRYLDGKTLNDLLRPGGFMDKDGHRYASNPKYERQLSSIINKIKNKYPELS